MGQPDYVVPRYKIDDLLSDIGAEEIEYRGDHEYILEAAVAFSEAIEDKSSAGYSRAIFALIVANALGVLIGVQPKTTETFSKALIADVLYPGRFIYLDDEVIATFKTDQWENVSKRVDLVMSLYIEIVSNHKDLIGEISGAVFDYVSSDGESSKWENLVRQYILANAYLKYLAN